MSAGRLCPVHECNRDVTTRRRARGAGSDFDVLSHGGDKFLCGADAVVRLNLGGGPPDTRQAGHVAAPSSSIHSQPLPGNIVPGRCPRRGAEILRWQAFGCEGLRFLQDDSGLRRVCGSGLPDVYLEKGDVGRPVGGAFNLTQTGSKSHPDIDKHDVRMERPLICGVTSSAPRLRGTFRICSMLGGGRWDGDTGACGRV